MTNSKVCKLGEKNIEVSLSTKVEIRKITDDDRSSFISAKWPVPKMPYYNAQFWNSICRLCCTKIKSEENLRSRFISALSDFDYFYPYLLGSSPVLSNARVELSSDDVDDDLIECLVSAGISKERIAECPPGRISYTLYCNGSTQTFSLSYPHDYCILLLILAEYLADEWSKAAEKAAKRRFGKKSPSLPDSPSLKTLDRLFTEHKSYIDSFIESAEAQTHRDNLEEFKRFEAGTKDDTKVLFVDSNIFFENLCDFNIDEKAAEIKKIQEKIKNSYNEGEKGVEYALKWFLSSNSQYVVPIVPDCESKYRYDCILLSKADFINEPQEYDHILVCPAGIVLIETKHWKGNVEIRPDGKWLRKPDTESPTVGIESPKLQMRRHELVMQEILPDVPIHSLLCFSNSSVVIDGRENFEDYPVITIDQLEDTLSSLCETSLYSNKDIEQMVEIINSHKVSTP